MKNWLDVIIKITSALAIFIPVLLFYLQYKNEVETKRNEALSELYVNIALNVEEVKNVTFNSNVIDSLSDNLLVKYPAKIAVYKIDSLNYYYGKVARDFKNYKSFKFFWNATNTLNANFENVFTSDKEGALPIYPKKYFIKFFDMSVADKVAQIDLYLPDFAAYEERNYHDLHTEFSQISSTYSSDPMLNKLGPAFNNAFEAADKMRTKLIALRSYLTEGNQQYFEYYFIPGPNRLSEPDQMMQNSLLYLKKGTQIFQKRLESDQDIFQKKVLFLIKD